MRAASAISVQCLGISHSLITKHWRCLLALFLFDLVQCAENDYLSVYRNQNVIGVNICLVLNLLSALSLSMGLNGRVQSKSSNPNMKMKKASFTMHASITETMHSNEPLSSSSAD